MSAPVLPDEEAGDACDRCGKPGAAEVMWSHAGQEWLCLVCREIATAVAHRMTLEQKRALDAGAREAS